MTKEEEIALLQEMLARNIKPTLALRRLATLSLIEPSEEKKE